MEAVPHYVPMTNHIRFVRDRLGITRDQLAHRVGTSTSQITKLERGERKLTQEWMERLAEALDVPPVSLISAWTIDVIGRVEGDGVVRYVEKGGYTKVSEVEAPANAPTSMRALEVHDAITGFAEKDAIIYFDWDKPMHKHEVLGKMSVVWTRDKRVLVRRIYPGATEDRWIIVSAAGHAEQNVDLGQAIPISWVRLP